MSSSSSRSSRGIGVGGSVRLFALLLVSIFFSAMIDQTDGLKCYLCVDKKSRSTSTFEQSAFDKIEAQINNATLAKGRAGRQSTDCKDSQSEWVQDECEGSTTTCVKIKFAIIGKVVRGCGKGTETLGCEKTAGGARCVCNTDLCNGGDFDSESGGKVSESSSSASSMSSIGGIFIIIISTMVASISATVGEF